MATTSTGLRVLGFPVHIRSGFLLFMLIVVVVNRTRFGIPLALAMAGFTLLHELGHAVAARRTGARAEISLDFLAGYTAFTPTRPLTRWERAGISFAGPAVQVVTGIAVYVLIGGDTSFPIHGLTPWQFAVLWAGPVIGLFNLLPVLPFDGGNIAQVAFEFVTPRHARRIMYGLTLGLVGGALVLMVSHPQWRPLMIFVLIPFISVIQMMSVDKERARRATGRDLLSRAEALAWATGQAGSFPPGTVPSPWFRAWQQLQAGDSDVARQLMLGELRHPASGVWWPPDAAPLAEIEAVLSLLPRPLPVAADPLAAQVLGAQLLKLGEYDEAGRYAAAAYGAHHSSTLARQVAAAAAALGDPATAQAWEQAAAR